MTHSPHTSEFHTKVSQDYFDVSSYQLKEKDIVVELLRNSKKFKNM